VKIGLFLDFPEDKLSGVGQHRMTILRSLSEHGCMGNHHFYVFSPRLPEYLADIETSSLTFVKIPRPPLLGRLLNRIYKKIRRTVLFYHPYPEILSSQARAMYNAKLLVPMLARYKVDACSWYSDDYRCLWVDKPYVLTVYDLNHRHQPEFPDVSANGEWFLREEFFSRAIPRAFRVIVDSEVGKEDVLRFYNMREDRVKVLPYLPAYTSAGSKPTNEQPVLKKYGLQPGYLFYPAQFWPHKNHIILLLALKQLRETHNISIKLALSGKDEGNLAYIQSMVKRFGLESQVFFLGFVPDKDMPVLYRNALTLVFPSFFGPTNIPPLEAFELGCPVIAADVRGVKAQLGDSALLVDPASAGQWAEAIFRLYSYPKLCDDLIQRGRNRVNQWKSEDYVRGMIGIFDELQPILRCWLDSSGNEK
jgi:glycosyltransferase involved in cell wall biosynthesis